MLLISRNFYKFFIPLIIILFTIKKSKIFTEPVNEIIFYSFLALTIVLSLIKLKMDYNTSGKRKQVIVMMLLILTICMYVYFAILQR